jgi:hypothetical protein
VYLVSQSYFGAMYAAALDPATGTELWRHTFAAGHGMNPATFFNGRLYLQRGNHGGDTQLWALAASDGATIWSSPFSAQWETYYAPAVNSSGIWINGGYYGGMYGFKHDGTQSKFVSLAQYDEWTPSLLGENVYSYVAGGFTKYDQAGNALWTNTRSWNWSGWSMNRVSALAGNRAFLIGNPDLYSVDLANGSTAWSVSGSFSGSPAVANGVVYAATSGGVNAYDAATGAFLRTYASSASITSPQPIVTGDAMFVTTSTETLIYHLGSGAILQRIPRTGSIAVADGAIYITPSTGGVYRYALQAATATLPLWATGDASWDAANHQLTVTGVATIYGEPDPDAVIIVSGASADLTLDISAPGSMKLGALKLSDGAQAHLVAGGGMKTLVVDTMSVDSGAKLDLTDHALVVRFGDLQSVQNLISQGLHGGDWLGTGITSSVCRGDIKYHLGVADNGSLAQSFGSAKNGPLFEGVDVGETAVLVKFTHRVDLNLDGAVNDADSIVFSTNYEAGASATWATGDLDMDGFFTDNDSVLFSTYYDSALLVL